MVLVKQPNPQHFAAMYQSNVFKNDEGKYTTSDHTQILKWTYYDRSEVSKIPQNNKQKIHKNCSSPILGQSGQFNLIPLLSLPGSGNTWTRYLLEQATGYQTGSVYGDPSLARGLRRGHF